MGLALGLGLDFGLALGLGLELGLGWGSGVRGTGATPTKAQTQKHSLRD